MSEVLLVKLADIDAFTEVEREAVRKFLFGAVDGHGREAKGVWRRLWSRITKAEIGEIFRLDIKQDRSGPYHRRAFAMFQTIFDAQERFENFEQFLNWVKVGSGWVEWVAGPKGGIVPLPKSVSYAKADQDEFMKFMECVLSFFRGEYAARYLWRHLQADRADQMMRELLLEFGE